MALITTNMQAIWLCISLLISATCGWPSPMSSLFTSTPSRHSFPSTSSGHVVTAQWNENYRPKTGAKVIADAYAKYGFDAPEDAAGIVGTSGKTAEDDDPDNTANAGSWGFGNPTPAINQTHDREYLSPIWIGSPAQPVLMDFDTGSADLWVFTRNSTKNSANSDRQVYTPGNSTSSSKIDGAKWMITYGDGSSASGTAYHDDVKLSTSNLTVKAAVVETATRVSSSITQDPAMSGLLGLAFNHNSTVSPRQPTFLSQLVDQGIDYFSVDIRWQNLSIYNFGYYEPSMVVGNLSWQPIKNDSDFWEVYMTTYRIGGQNVKYIHSYNVVVDTGTTLALLPDAIVKNYYDAVNGSVYSSEYAGYTFPCDTVLPDFIFGFADDLSEYTVPGYYMNYMPTDNGFCYGGIQSNVGLSFSLLGDIFLKAVYAVFDNSKQAVGFGNKDLNSPPWPYTR